MAIGKEPVIYVTRDIERALGMEPGPGYFIVSNHTPYSESIQKQFPDQVTLIYDDKGKTYGTGDLMKDPKALEVFERVGQGGGKPRLLVFKNTARIEPIAHERGWSLLNPPSALSEKIENKVSQIGWLGSMEQYLPPHRIEFMKNVRWDGSPFILQWAHGHTGGGTILVNSEANLAPLKEKFPERRCRITSYIEGAAFTLNAVVTPDRILQSSVSYQITGHVPFTESRFATIGNDWGLAAKMLSAEDQKWICTLADEIGLKMQKEGWRGLFGIDVIRDSSTGKIYLIEINARQPASTSFESHLQEIRRREGATGVTTFEAHLMALLGETIKGDLVEIKDGAQVIQRVTSKTRSVSPETVGALELEGFKVVVYNNMDENADLIRIQSKNSIMRDDGSWNETGDKIIAALK